MSERDIFATASVIIRQYQEAAPHYAARRADELLDVGDIEGASTWRRIAKAIEHVLAESSDGQVKH